MKTTLDLDDEALERALRLSAGMTPAQVVNEALREYARERGRPKGGRALSLVTRGRKKEPTSAKTAKAPAGRVIPAYQLRVELMEVEPAIWRRLRVRGDIKLGLLHAVIQVAMGWTNSHLHQFKVGDRLFVDPNCEVDDFGGPPLLDEHPVALSSVAPDVGGRFVYEYDFGDSWEHTITVEGIAGTAPELTQFAECLDGRRACPPEDCGGAHGYEEFLAAIGNRKHREHKSMIEWVGGPFDPEAFDLGKANAYLRKLKWPRVSIEQLGRVLMQRDGVKG